MLFDRHTFLALLLAGQDLPKPNQEEQPKRLPDGTLQSEAILKSEHKRMLADVKRMGELTKDIEAELEKFGHHVLSTGLLKKLEEIEKLARRMRGRYNR